MTTLALFSNKGGVGKTTAAVNLAYLAARSGQRTLLCDLDPQSSATFYLNARVGLESQAQGLPAGPAIAESIQNSAYKNLDLLPADFTHRNLDISFYQSAERTAERALKLRQALLPLQQAYDWIILDCPPTINILAENVFYAADHLLVPVIPTILAVRTYAQLMTFLRVKEYILKSVHAFFSLVDRRKKMHCETIQAVHETFKNVLKTIIPYLSVIEQMGLKRRPLPDFAPRNPATKAYWNLWSEYNKAIGFTSKR